MRLKLLQKDQFKKKGEETGDLIDNKVANKITKISKTLQKNYLETFKNEHDKVTPKERYISSEERQNIIDDLGIIIKV